MNKIIELQKKRDDAYREWKNAIKKALKGVEKRVFDEENDMEFAGICAWLESYGSSVCVFVDRITYNETHNMFKVHISAYDYKECNKWISQSDATHEIENIDEILEHIVW